MEEKKFNLEKLLKSKVYGDLVREVTCVMRDVMPYEDITLEMVLSETYHYVNHVWPAEIYSETGSRIISDEKMLKEVEAKIRKGKTLMKRHNYTFDGRYPHLEYMDKM